VKNRGWIKLHRSILEHPHWMSEPFTRAQAWIDLLLLANHKESHIRKRGVLVVVDRGALGYDERTLAERWKWSRGKVRRFLQELTEEKRINRKISQKTIPKNTSVSACIYILNYEKYQSGDTENSTEDSTEDGTRTRMLKNKKNIYTSDFLTFWAAYPRKIGKQAAFKAWQKNNLPSLDNILQSIGRQKQSDQWKDERFIPHPATWLNQGRWEDEIKVKGDSW